MFQEFVKLKIGNKIFIIVVIFFFTITKYQHIIHNNFHQTKQSSYSIFVVLI